jgi:hypothetical protein
MENPMHPFEFARGMLRPAFVGLALTLVIAACGGSAPSAPAGDASSDGSGGGAPTAAVGEAAAVNDTVLTREGGLCELLPLDQVEIALGAVAVEAEASKSSLGLGHSCRVTVDEETILDVNRSEKETIDEFKEAFEAVGLTDETVEGLGEFAYRAPGTALGGPGARLAVYTGERHIGITVYAEGSQATMFEASEAIVRALLEAGL